MITPVDIFYRVDTLIKLNLMKEFKRQGHSNTGAWEASITSKVSSGTSLQGFALSYGSILNFGVTPQRVPFNQGSGAKTSKYITGLTNYWLSKGLSAKDAKAAAFATAIKQKREGMPTSESYKYSSSGQRKNFIDIVNDTIGKDVDEEVIKGFDELFDEQFYKNKSETI